jgi:hypothetical protein
MYKIIIPLMALATTIIFPITSYSQSNSDSIGDLGRIFMPAVQIGYISHGTTELTGGLITQTSIEYRDISNFIFRVNYDVFNSNMNLKYPIDSSVSFTGKTSFSDFIVGIGYRLQRNKHNLTGYIQSGWRFYGYPTFHFENNQVNLDYDSRNIGTIRYSLGYEYAISTKLFLTIEGLISQSLKSKDFWAKNKWAYGATIGISAPLF